VNNFFPRCKKILVLNTDKNEWMLSGGALAYAFDYFEKRELETDISIQVRATFELIQFYKKQRLKVKRGPFLSPQVLL
jgi:hypothetical protein